jgi:hypothetical protein
MAQQKCDSFDLYNGIGVATGTTAGLQSGPYTAGASSQAGPAGIVTMVTGRFGGQAVEVSNNNFGGGVNAYAYFYRLLPLAYTTLTFGFAFQVASSLVGCTTTFFSIMQGPGYATPQLSLTYNANGQILVYRGANAALLASSPNNTIQTGNWYYIEVSVTISSSVGTVNLNVNGAAVITPVTGANTQGGSTNTAVAPAWQAPAVGNGNPIGVPSGSGSLSTFYVDDFYWRDDLTMNGPCRVTPLRGTANSSVQWTPDSGSNYARINETLVDADSSYVASNTLNQSDLYTLDTMPYVPLTIFGVQAVDFARTTDANARGIYQQLSSGGTLDLGPTTYLASNYLKYDRMLVNDPHTSATWTYAAINALLRGPQLAA